MSKVQYQQKPASQQQVAQPTQQRKPYNNRRENPPVTRSSNYGKPRYQDKEARHQNKHGFEYNESKISYNTEIPEMPQKPKQKPDEVKFNKKVDELENKAKELKKLRKEKKESYKNGSKLFTDKIDEQKHKIDLAKACLIVLNYDKSNIEKDIEDVQNKINTHKRKIDLLSKPTQRTTKHTKIEDMSYVDLVKEEQRITQEMSTRKLSKAEEVQYSNQLNKIKKRKIEVPKKTVSSHEQNEKEDEIQSHRNALEKLRTVRQTLADRITDIENKIESIEDAIQDFEQAIEQIHEKLRTTDNSKLLEEAADLKNQIYAIWDEIEQLKEQHKIKTSEYEQEQEKIKYIKWAQDIKTKKAQAWEQQKQQRKKQRLREKERPKKTDDKPTKEGQKKQGQTEGQDRFGFERKKINRNQKEIDACAFLIQYCKDLNSGASKTEDKSTSQKQVKIEQALKKGEWAKMKNVEVIQSKKKKAEEQAEQKTFKKKENKNVTSQPTDRFSHTYFVAQVFDSVKVLPPTKTDDLEKLINELDDKMEYYIAHPDEQVGRTILPGKEAERETKGKGPRRIINTEEFPSLR